MNQIQVIGTHNSYHREVSRAEASWHDTLLSAPENYYYSHATLPHQASHQSVRAFELDIWADPSGGNYATPLIKKLAGQPYPADPAMRRPGTKVLHVSDLDVDVTCYTLVECLRAIRAWSQAHPQHVPIATMIEFKTASPLRTGWPGTGGAKAIPWTDAALLAALDDEFRAVFAPGEMITPDDLRRGTLTLEESVLQFGWPDLDSARGRVMFCMDDGAATLGAVRAAYVEGRPSLEGRVLFSQSAPGEADCAFQKLNTPTGEEQAVIREQVRKGYWVRTRCDIPIETVLSNDTTSMRDAAFSSGAQMVTTDWPVVGMSARYNVDYAVRWPGGKTARCNPVTSEGVCTNETVLEPPEYYQN